MKNQQGYTTRRLTQVRQIIDKVTEQMLKDTAPGNLELLSRTLERLERVEISLTQELARGNMDPDLKASL